MINEKYKITVIVPAYNLEDCLPRCLDSILCQTHNNLEIIIISDGSTDGTNDIIKKYASKDKRIVPVFKENSGVSDTRNRGLDIATGEYIGFVDGDDYIEPNMYEVLLRNALEYDADISHCGYQMVFPSRIDYYYNTGRKVIQNRKKGIVDLIVGSYIEPGVWNKLYRKEIISDLKFDAEIREMEDFLFNIYAFKKANKSYYEDVALYSYILRKGSASTGKIKDYHIKGKMQVAECLLNEFSSDSFFQKYAVDYYLSSNIRMYRSVVFTDDECLKTLKKSLKNNIKFKKDYLRLASKRNKVERFLLLYFPWLYCGLFRILKFRKNKYEIR